MSIVNSSVRDSIIAEKLVSYYASQQEANNVVYYTGTVYDDLRILIEAECEERYNTIEIAINLSLDSGIGDPPHVYYIGEIKLEDSRFKFYLADDVPTFVLDLLYYYFSNDSN